MSGHWTMLTAACLEPCITRLICTKTNSLNYVCDSVAQFMTVNLFCYYYYSRLTASFQGHLGKPRVRLVVESAVGISRYLHSGL